MTSLSPTEAERQAADSASNYAARALRIVAEHCGRMTTYRQDPGAVAREFPALVAALIEAQSREYMAWALCSRLGEIAGPMESAGHELSAWVTRIEGAQGGGRP